MNKVIIKGRFTRDPEVRYISGSEPVCVARFSIACDDRERGRNEDGGYPTNFIPCVCMGKCAEIVEANFFKGKEALICGKMQSGSYVNREGKTVYTLECFVQEIEFCGKREESPASCGGYTSDSDGFMNIPDGIDDELPFK